MALPEALFFENITPSRLYKNSCANEREQQAPVACRFCEDIFVDNKSLLDHFQSHLKPAGASNGRPLVGSSVNGRDYVAHESIGPSSWQNISPNMPNQSLGSSRVTTLSQNSVQLRGGSTLTSRPHPFLSPPETHGTFTSKLNQSSNFRTRFAAQSRGPLNFRSPIKPPRPDIFASQATQQSNSSFPTDSGASGLAARQTRRLLQTVRRNEVESSSSGYTRPYIELLERPIQEIILVHDDDDVAGNPVEVDLTLKLGLF